MKKSNMVILALIIIVIIIGIWWFLLRTGKTENMEEYTPQEEISEEQERQSLVTLYFKNKETGMLMPEARMISAKLLIQNPYETLVGLLIEGPKNDKLTWAVPEGTKLISANIDGDTVIVDLSEEFVKGMTAGIESESKIVYSIVNTLTELTEVNAVKILVNGDANSGFEDGELNFREPFARMK